MEHLVVAHAQTARRTCAEHGTQHVETPLVARGADTALVGIGVVELDVGGQPLGHLLVEGGLGRHLVEAAVVEDTVLEVVREGDAVARILRTARKRHVVVLRPSGTKHLVLPVDTRDLEVVLGGLIAVRLAVGVLALTPVGVESRLLLELGELVVVQQVERLGNLPVAGRTAVRDRRLADLARLGRDEHYAVGRTRTVDGRRRSVFQHVDLLDVAARQVVDIVHLESVDDIERSGIAVDRADTADLDLESRARRTVGRGDLHTRDLAAESAEHRSRLITFDVLGRNRSDGTRQVGTLRGAVAHDDDLIHDVGVGLEFDLEIGLRTHFDLLGLVAQIGDDERGVLLDRKGELAVDVGGSPLRGAADDDIGTDGGLSVLIHHTTRYLGLRRRRKSQRQGHKGQQKTLMKPDGAFDDILHSFSFQLG